MDTGIIYKITSPSGRIYIGQTINYIDRIRRYASLRCKTQPKLYRSFIKYGYVLHKIEVIEHIKVEDLSIREIYWIKFYNSKDEGLNCDNGGRGGSMGRKVLDKTREKMSKSHKGRIPINKGVPMSEEQKIKLRNPKTEEHKKKLSLMCKSKKSIICNETGEIFNSIREASIKMNLDYSNLKSVISNKQKTIKGFTFKKL